VLDICNFRAGGYMHVYIYIYMFSSITFPLLVYRTEIGIREPTIGKKFYIWYMLYFRKWRKKKEQLKNLLSYLSTEKLCVDYNWFINLFTLVGIILVVCVWFNWLVGDFDRIIDDVEPVNWSLSSKLVRPLAFDKREK
jgi:hypothetical protein